MNKLFKITSLLTGILAPVALFAQDAAKAADATAAATAAPEAASWYQNPVAMIMVSILLILLFVILLLSKTVFTALDFYKAKKREELQSKVNKPTIVSILLAIFTLSSFAAFAQDAAAAAAATPAPVKLIGGMNPTLFYFLFAIFVLEALAIIALLFAIRFLVGLERRPSHATSTVKKFAWWDKLNKTKSVDATSEAEVNWGHNYDGIEELDNPTPPWWMAGFIISIIASVIYLYRYEVGHTAPNQYQELAAEIAKGEAAKKAYLASSANNVDETNVTVLTDANDIAAGKTIFIAVCAACHLADGGGSVGPNLTDDYFIHGGSIKDIFKTIKYGVPEKGMKSWKDDYSPRQIQELASFVMSLHGTKPATPKAPQGDLYKPDAAAAPAAADSTQAAAPKDTAAKK